MRFNKHALAAVALLPILGSGSAFALSCVKSTNYIRLDVTQVKTLLIGQTVCYPQSGPYENQESLDKAGNVTDFKKGPSDKVDPTKVVGAYTVTTDGYITYNYIGGGSYTYQIFGNTSTLGPGTWDFCNGAAPITVRVVAGTSGCGS